MFTTQYNSVLHRPLPSQQQAIIAWFTSTREHILNSTMYQLTVSNNINVGYLSILLCYITIGENHIIIFFVPSSVLMKWKNNVRISFIMFYNFSFWENIWSWRSSTQKEYKCWSKFTRPSSFGSCKTFIIEDSKKIKRIKMLPMINNSSIFIILS